jgi:modulator of FtsH protease
MGLPVRKSKYRAQPVRELHRSMDLEAWHDFHVITGGAAAALVGLLFVVISVGPGIGARRPESVRAFISPTVAFFATPLVLAGIMTMPNLSVNTRGIAVCGVGFAGVLFLAIAGIYSQWRKAKLGVEDLLCYLVLPMLTYAGLFAGGIGIMAGYAKSLPLIGTAIIGLLALALRNAWDLVIFTARMTQDEHEHAARP